MATQSVSLTRAPSQAQVIGVTRLAITAGLSLALIFVLCWVGTFVPFSSPTHAFVGLFTPAETQSITALLEGGFWSLLFGLAAGAVFGLVYNGLGRIERNG